MKHRLSLVLLLGLLAGCASTETDIRTQYDRNIDFARYKTFSFAPGKVVDKPGYEKIDKARLEDRFRTAARAEMEARGLDYVTENPDLIVTYTAGAQKREDLVRVQPAVSYSGVGTEAWDVPGAWRPAGWYAEADDQFWSKEYTEGTLILDIFDAKSKEPVWKTYATVQIMQNDPPKNLVPDTVARALKGFPPPKK